MTNALSVIFDNIKKTEQLPVIFAGSGITKRYTNKKYNWEELLINCIAAYSDSPENTYRLYETKAKYRIRQESAISQNKYTVNEAIGSEIEHEFNTAYYEGRIENLEVPDRCNPLKFYISKLLSDYELDHNMKEEIDLFSDLSAKMMTVVTTNYDSFFEDHVFLEHDKIVGQDVFNKSEVGTLFKIHGCVSDSESIIITKEDYDVFKRKRKILSAKLISLFTENPVIFMGYSLYDENVRDILTDIFTCLEVDEKQELEKRLIMVEYQEGIDSPIVGNHSVDFGDGIYLNLTKITLTCYVPLLKELQMLERTVKFRELRYIKDLVYDIVHSEEAANKKIINMLGDQAVDDNEVIIGFMKQATVLNTFGITGLTRDRLLDDLLLNDLFPLNSKNQIVELKLLIENQIPNLLISNVSLPIHKYLRILKNYPNVHFILTDRVKTLIEKEVDDYLNTGIEKSKTSYVNYNFDSFDDIMKSDAADYRKLYFLVLLAIDKNSPDELRDFLESNKGIILTFPGGSTHLGKLACIYDIQKYKNA